MATFVIIYLLIYWVNIRTIVKNCVRFMILLRPICNLLSFLLRSGTRIEHLNRFKFTGEGLLV